MYVPGGGNVPKNEVPGYLQDDTGWVENAGYGRPLEEVK